MPKKHRANRKQLLWLCNTYDYTCHWCRGKVDPDLPEAHPSRATRDHLYQRGDPQRDPKVVRGTDIVLSCFKCNNGRSNVPRKTVMKGESITCPICKETSYNSSDIVYKYCGNCHLFWDVLTEEEILDLRTKQENKRNEHLPIH